MRMHHRASYPCTVRPSTRPFLLSTSSAVLIGGKRISTLDSGPLGASAARPEPRDIRRLPGLLQCIKSSRRSQYFARTVEAASSAPASGVLYSASGSEAGLYSNARRTASRTSRDNSNIRRRRSTLNSLGRHASTSQRKRHNRLQIQRVAY
ncbi:hypothetical protein K438DRAFT_1962598 [Mycena galopus ATCC 62051]|nr:hypothetical protein K438DRAFT_1962598 [Mycena galopus ATCC 62051]